MPVVAASATNTLIDSTRNAFNDVFSQALGRDWKLEVGPSPETAPDVEASVFVGLLVTGVISGQAGLLVSRADAALIGCAFVGDTSQPSPEYGDEQREAFEELLRQVFGLVTTALQGTYGQLWIEVDPAVPVAEPSQRVGLLVTSASKPSPISMELWVSPELANSFTAADQAPAPNAAPRPSNAATDSPNSVTDLSLLEGVEVEITLRFGHRRLLLREIARLTSGSVVELDESVADPVEVVVGEHVIARGEIVSVDGCYGVRITEVPDPPSALGAEALGAVS